MMMRHWTINSSTLEGTNIPHLGQKQKHLQKCLVGDLLVTRPRRSSFQFSFKPTILNNPEPFQPQFLNNLLVFLISTPVVSKKFLNKGHFHPIFSNETTTPFGNPNLPWVGSRGNPGLRFHPRLCKSLASRRCMSPYYKAAFSRRGANFQEVRIFCGGEKNAILGKKNMRV